jgi:hypothetical protein
VRAHFLAALTWLGCWGCGEPELQVSFPYRDDLPDRLIDGNAAWSSACERPAAERIGLPVALRPEPPHRPVDHGLIAELTQTIAELQEPYARLFQRHTCAVVLMHGSPMTGTLRVLDAARGQGIILLNVDNLSPPGGDWLAFKEASAFATVPDRVFRGTMARPEEHRRRILLEFLLVHELAHLVDNLFPDDPLIQSFNRVSWPRRDGLVKTPLVHYPSRLAKAPLPDALLEPYYDLIGASAFPSPAAIANSREDFAESVSTFMHTMQRGRPWQIDVYRGGRHIRQLRTCWEEARCAEKRRLLEALLAQWRQD